MGIRKSIQGIVVLKCKENGGILYSWFLASKSILKYPTRCNNEQSIFYFTAVSLNMFRASLHPSSGVQETVVTATGMVIYPGELGSVKVKQRYKVIACVDQAATSFQLGLATLK
jgi:hypothetical protein